MKVITTTKEYNEKGQVIKEVVMEENKQDEYASCGYLGWEYPNYNSISPYEPFKITQNKPIN